VLHQENSQEKKLPINLDHSTFVSPLIRYKICI